MTSGLHDVPLRDGPVTLAGAFTVDTTPDGGIVPCRLPEAARRRIPDIITEAMVRTPSGVRLAFRTTASVVELDVRQTRLHFVDETEHPPPATYELVAGHQDGSETILARDCDGGTVVRIDANRQPTHVPGGVTTLRFADLGTGPKDIEIWLPPSGSTELRALRADADVTAPPRRADRLRWIHHGSSISQCSEAEHPTGTWPVVAARLAGVDVTNLGFGGSCHLDQFVARTIRDLDVDLISVKLGINVVNADSMRERAYRPALDGFLDTIRDGHPDTPLLVVSPIICPTVEDHPGPTFFPNGTVAALPRPTELVEGALTLRRIREITADTVARRAADDPHLHYLDGLTLFGPDDVALLPDGLHPNTEGYRKIGERFHTAAFGPGGPFTDAKATG